MIAYLYRGLWCLTPLSTMFLLMMMSLTRFDLTILVVIGTDCMCCFPTTIRSRPRAEWPHNLYILLWEQVENYRVRLFIFAWSGNRRSWHGITEAGQIGPKQNRRQVKSAPDQIIVLLCFFI